MAADLLLRRRRRDPARARKGESVALVSAVLRRGELAQGRLVDAARGGRLLQLLWDDTLEVRGALGVPLPHESRVEELFVETLAAELGVAMNRTRAARAARARPRARRRGRGGRSRRRDSRAAEGDRGARGEKLNEKIELARKARKDLGAGFVDDAQLADARRLAREVCRDQASNLRVLLELVRPAAPAMAVCGRRRRELLARGTFHQIGRWAEGGPRPPVRARTRCCSACGSGTW